VNATESLGRCARHYGDTNEITHIKTKDKDLVRFPFFGVIDFYLDSDQAMRNTSF